MLITLDELCSLCIPTVILHLFWYSEHLHSTLCNIKISFCCSRCLPVYSLIIFTSIANGNCLPLGDCLSIWLFQHRFFLLVLSPTYLFSSNSILFLFCSISYCNVILKFLPKTTSSFFDLQFQKIQFISLLELGICSNNEWKQRNRGDDKKEKGCGKK